MKKLILKYYILPTLKLLCHPHYIKHGLWKSCLMYEIKRLMRERLLGENIIKITEIENGLKGIGVLENAKDDLQNKIDILVALLVQKNFPEIAADDIHCSFYWECEKSPFGWCVYNKLDDPAADQCLYCGQPLERK